MNNRNYLIDYALFAPILTPLIMIGYVFLLTLHYVPLIKLDRQPPTSTQSSGSFVVINCEQRQSYIDTVEPMVIEAVRMVEETTISRQYNNQHLIINQHFAVLSRVPSDTLTSAADVNAAVTELLTSAYGILKSGDNESYTAISQRDYTHVDIRLPELDEFIAEYELRKSIKCETGTLELEP